MEDNSQIFDLNNNQKSQINKNLYKYLFIVSLILLLIVATILCLSLITPKGKKTDKQNDFKGVINNEKNANDGQTITSTNEGNILIYNYTYNSSTGNKDTEKILKYNIANNSIQELQLNGYKVIDYYMYLSRTKYIFLIKDNQIFVYDISTSKITKTSLPNLKEDKNYQEKINLIAFSKNQNNVIFKIKNYDKNDPGPDIGGGPNPLNSKEYIYTIDDNKTTTSDISTKITNITKNSNTRIIGWDSIENVLFVEYWPNPADGYGDSVFARLNLNKNTITKATKTQGLSYVLSPSYKQIAIPDIHEGKIFIYDTDDLAKIKKELDVPQLKTFTIPSQSQEWSPNEDEIAIGLDKDIYTVNINSGILTLRYTDNTLGMGYLYWSRNIIAYSTSGNFLFITDRDNSNQSNLEQGLYINKTIKIDLTTNKSEVITTTNLEKENSEILSTAN